MTTETNAGLRFGINSYLDWVAKEGLNVASGVSLNLFEVETADWPRYGVKAAACHFKGSGDYTNMFLVELPAGGSTSPQQHLYEEIYYVLEGRGSTQLEFADGRRHSFEWGPKSLFAIPLNAKYRHFNASGRERALVVETTNLPQVMNLFRNEDFIFNTKAEFSDRAGDDKYFAGEGDLHLLRPGNNVWQTNFIPDLATVELQPWEDRGAGSSSITFLLSNSSMHAHISEIAPATYKKAHRHMGGTHVLTLTGDGYSLLWENDGADFTRVDWSHGVVFPPCEGQFHQHFVTSENASRYVATNVGNLRYPLTEARRRISLSTPSQKQATSRSVKEGGDQIEYEDQDPRIHQIWLEEMRRRGITPRLTLPTATAGRTA
jgi:mannose-6-phosphate isomerase-like protein (cupin superfamily)